MTQLQQLKAQFLAHGVTLIITRKAVKNINFRVRKDVCHISTPLRVGESQLISAIKNRQQWILDASRRQLDSVCTKPTLWGEFFDPKSYERLSDLKIPKSKVLNDDELLLAIYRHQLQLKIDELAKKWQPIVGKSAKEIHLKKMTSRWGSCNTHHARIWLSIYLAAYPYECTEYVFVHELCHLHHAHHQPSFWKEVKKAMPNYRIWHDRLRQKQVVI